MSYVPPLRGVAYDFFFPVFDAAGNFKSGATFVTVQVDQDGSNFATADGTPAEIQTSGCYKLALIASEMDGKIVQVRITCSDAKPVWARIETQDRIPELPQAQPPATPTLDEAIMLLYMKIRNQTTADSTVEKIRNDAGTVVVKAAIDDTAGVFTRDKLAAGP